MENRSGKDYEKVICRAFELWKENPTGEGHLGALGVVLSFASKNGIDLIMAVPKSALDKPPFMKPMMDDTDDLASGEDEQNRFFDIPSQMNQAAVEPRKRFRLLAEPFNDIPSVLLITPTQGVVGIFHSDEITSIEAK